MKNKTRYCAIIQRTSGDGVGVLVRRDSLKEMTEALTWWEKQENFDFISHFLKEEFNEETGFWDCRNEALPGA